MSEKELPKRSSLPSRQRLEAETQDHSATGLDQDTVKMQAAFDSLSSLAVESEVNLQQEPEQPAS